MEAIAKGLVGRQVVISIATKMGSFQRTGEIVDVQDGVVRIKGPSGMEGSIPIKDKWMRITEIRANSPETI